MNDTAQHSRDTAANIHQRLNAVMHAVAYLQKDKQVQTGGEGSYKAVTHDAVTAAVRPHFLAHGIGLEATIVGSQTVDTTRRTKSGNPIWRFEATYAVSFVNIDRPTDRITLHVAAHAEDQGDKAPGKALSYAVKYAILKVLMLETGDDEEGRVGTPDVELGEEETEALATLRGAAMEGEAALGRAYNGLAEATRVKLVGRMRELKGVAKEADKMPGRGA